MGDIYFLKEVVDERKLVKLPTEPKEKPKSFEGSLATMGNEWWSRRLGRNPIINAEGKVVGFAQKIPSPSSSFAQDWSHFRDNWPSNGSYGDEALADLCTYVEKQLVNDGWVVGMCDYNSETTYNKKG